MMQLTEKLIRLKQKLKWWNKQVFGNVFSKVQKMEEEVAKAEADFDSQPDDCRLINMKKAYAGLNQALAEEELFWKQKAAVRWVLDGERNSKFFHNLVRQKRAKNKILRIKVGTQWIEQGEQVKASAATYFEQILGVSGGTEDNCDWGCIPRLVNEHNNLDLCRIPELDEVRAVVFSLNPNSVAGTDGFTAKFFQHCWELVAKDVLEAVVEFFQGSPMPRKFTATSISLILKVENPQRWSDFRPISLCNVTNKIISKILNNRLSLILPSLVSANQSGFIKGRLITDNILLAQELVHSINDKIRGGNLLIKLDMAKAYDRLE